MIECKLCRYTHLFDEYHTNKVSNLVELGKMWIEKLWYTVQRSHCFITYIYECVRTLCILTKEAKMDKHVSVARDRIS